MIFKWSHIRKFKNISIFHVRRLLIQPTSSRHGNYIPADESFHRSSSWIILFYKMFWFMNHRTFTALWKAWIPQLACYPTRYTLHVSICSFYEWTENIDKSFITIFPQRSNYRESVIHRNKKKKKEKERKGNDNFNRNSYCYFCTYKILFSSFVFVFVFMKAGSKVNLTSCASNWFTDHNEWQNRILSNSPPFSNSSVYYWIEIAKK